jgi:hypothetical protein
LLALNFIVCGGGGGGGGTDNVNTPSENTPYDGIAPQFLHYTLPDQYAYELSGKPVADERAAHFPLILLQQRFFIKTAPHWFQDMRSLSL